MRGRDADEAALDGIGQHFVVLWQDVVSTDMRQHVGENVAKFHVTEVALLNTLTTDAVCRVTQQVWLCTSSYKPSSQSESDCVGFNVPLDTR